jgi:H+/Cl- antiporter ClcA
LDEELHFRPTRLPWVVFIAGCSGTALAFFMQYFAAVLHYPLNVGGRPLNSWPAFVPLMFELTVLAASLTALVVMVGLNGLPRPHHPLFGNERFERATRDRFFLCFALSFALEGVNRVLLYLLVGPNEDAPVYYLVRLVAYGLIIAAIVGKNREAAREPPRAAHDRMHGRI